MMVLITLCMYTMPYQKLHINLLELFVMTDLVVLLMVALTEQFKVDYCICTYVCICMCNKFYTHH